MFSYRELQMYVNRLYPIFLTPYLFHGFTHFPATLLCKAGLDGLTLFLFAFLCPCRHPALGAVLHADLMPVVEAEGDVPARRDGDVVDFL